MDIEKLCASKKGQSLAVMPIETQHGFSALIKCKFLLFFLFFYHFFLHVLADVFYSVGQEIFIDCSTYILNINK